MSGRNATIGSQNSSSTGPAADSPPTTHAQGTHSSSPSTATEYFMAGGGAQHQGGATGGNGASHHHHHHQAWSITHFYYVDFLQSWIGVKLCVFYKCTIKVWVSHFWRCPGTSAPRVTRLTVVLYLCSNARDKSRTLEWRRVSSKSPSRVWDGDKAIAGRGKEQKSVPPTRGSLICPSGKFLIKNQHTVLHSLSF